MCERTLILFKYMSLVLILVFFFASCTEYDNYRRVSNGANSRSDKPVGSSQMGIGKQYTKDSQTSNKLDVTKTKFNENGIPEDIAISTDVNSDKQKPFLDRYEELLKQLMENEKEINQYKGKQTENEKTINKLEATVETFIAELEVKKRQAQELQNENEKLINQFTEERNGLEEKEDKYRNEIEELKVKLVEAQLSEVKAKQELIRVKTQYVMDKKRFGIKED